ncbi:MAG: hypothetical protein AUI10_12100 [Actinobacteria bacterium 13_2_20CM_2_72_6]|nr:MAG: hypothetical protein AUI10_12100 [Actinobacteria bacterium 13_2_20CM_2_72_6]
MPVVAGAVLAVFAAAGIASSVSAGTVTGARPGHLVLQAPPGGTDLQPQTKAMSSATLKGLVGLV